jgi:hypothetical protein
MEKPILLLKAYPIKEAVAIFLYPVKVLKDFVKPVSFKLLMQDPQSCAEKNEPDGCP